MIAPERCDYVLGNPPFAGAKHQSAEQRKQVHDIARLDGVRGTLDFVSAWFLKAGEYLNRANRPKGLAFVATNSITQGEQVAQLWPPLFQRHGLEISFAHRTFAWGSDAGGMAHVHVVILGLVKRSDEPRLKRLFSYPDIKGEPEETVHSALSAYLMPVQTDIRHQVIASQATPLFHKNKLITGSKPVDGGFYIMEESEVEGVLAIEPELAPYIKPYIGANEFIDGSKRYILTAFQVPPEVRRGSNFVKDRISSVRRFRLGEIVGKNGRKKKTPDPDFAAAADRFHVTVVPTSAFLAVPQTSSERREYAPIGWLSPPTVPSDKLRLLESAELFEFAILTSTMHMAWMRTVTGRMKSDYMYSVGVVYNTFPWPDLGDKAMATLSRTGQAILNARDNHPGAMLADLYDPDAMPFDLRKAHRENDRAVDRLYRRNPFESERARVEFLFARYEELCGFSPERKNH